MSAPAPIFEWTRAWCEDRSMRLDARLEISSTNTIAKDDEDATTRPHLSEGAFSEPTLYLARRQTAGRGRGSHVWTAPEGGTLLASWCFAIARVPQPIFSALVGLALFEAAKATWPSVAFNVKAPNDLFIGTKKTAGILIETIDQGREKRTVIGLGLNVSVKPEEIETATCLQEHLPQGVTENQWHSFLDAWQLRLDEALRAGSSETLEPDVQERLRAALNLHPLLKEPILRVDERAQLHSASRVIYWHEL